MSSGAAAIAKDIRLDGAMPGEGADPHSLDQVLSRLAVPGVSVASIESGAIGWAEGWGVADADDQTPVGPRTLFQAGSISKPVAALVVLRLVAEGVLTLETAIDDLLRSWRVPANGTWRPRLTVRQLLSHTAGLTVHGFPGYNRDTPIPTTAQVLSGAGNTAAVRVLSVPGFQFSYSGGGYVVLQQLVEDVVERPFPDVARELVFDPLEMDDSTFEQPLPSALWERAASGHRTGGAPVRGRWHVYPEMAAGGLWTTSTDLARFLIAIRGARSPAGILPEWLAAEMLTRQAPNAPVGLGLFFDEGIGGGRAALPPEFTFGHGGDDQGFVAVSYITEASGDGAVVMTNSDEGGPVIVAIAEAIARARGWLAQEQASGGEEHESVAADILAGRYRLVDREAELAADGDDLLLTVSEQPAIRFIRASPSSWSSTVVRATVHATETPGQTFLLRQDVMYARDEVAERLA